MLFTSQSFIVFLAVLFSVYYLTPGRFQWFLLLAADVLFYSCAGWQGLVFMSVTVAVSWLSTNLMRLSRGRQEAYLKSNREILTRDERRAYKTAMERKRLAMLIAALAADLGILAVLKYANFAITNVNYLFGASIAGVDWVLPLGLSFYTFQTVSYVIDVYWDKVEAERNILKAALFTSFFPLLIQGPISRFGDIKSTLFASHKADGKQITFGLERIICGYFKKLVVADRLVVAVAALSGDPGRYPGAFAVLNALFYAAQLYADFTGGIDITIGIAQVLGIKVQENFRRPYFSRSVAEYWRRWHISMGTWFRDYVFYPVSASGWLMALTEKAERISGGLSRRLAVYIPMAVTWFLTGLWHGAAWHFVVWGLLNAALMLAGEEIAPASQRFRKKHAELVSGFGYRVFETLRTFAAMCSLRMLDCYKDVGLSFRMFAGIFTTWNWGEAFSGPLLSLGLTGADYLIAGIGTALMFALSVFEEKNGDIREAFHGRSVWLRGAVFTALLLSTLVFGAYGAGYDSSQFIYNQF